MLGRAQFGSTDGSHRHGRFMGRHFSQTRVVASVLTVHGDRCRRITPNRGTVREVEAALQ